jgi:hypothetical protein
VIDGYWLSSHRADPRGLALYRRHYSAAKNAPYRRRRSLNFVGPGSPLILLTQRCDALFVWVKNTGERYDGQVGVSCAVFRNESPTRSSDLIVEADALAWVKWPGERHFTYVDPVATARRRGRLNPPGYCFLQAGWTSCGASTTGLVLLERRPEAQEVAA